MDFIFERKINYYETDKMGIVHHSNYIRFLEEARCKMLEQFEMPYSSFESNGIMIPVLGVNCSFKHHVPFLLPSRHKHHVSTPHPDCRKSHARPNCLFRPSHQGCQGNISKYHQM